MDAISKARLDVRIAKRAVIHSKNDSIDELDVKFGTLKRKEMLLDGLESVEAILRGTADEINTVRTEHAEDIPDERESVLRKLLRAHRRMEDATLELGAYLGFWEIVDTEVEAC